jgi:hypothetical protein
LKYVLLCFVDHADHEGKNMWPSIRQIVFKTEYSETEVHRCVRDLIEMGLLVEEGTGPHGTKLYSLGEGGAVAAPVPQRQGAKLPVEGGAKFDDQFPDLRDIVAPELNVLTNTTDKEIKTETSPGFLALQSAASQIWPTDTSQWRVLKAALLRSEIEMQDGAIRVTGLGQAAAMFQANYGRAFERALVGVLNQTTEVRFEE